CSRAGSRKRQMPSRRGYTAPSDVQRSRSGAIGSNAVLHAGQLNRNATVTPRRVRHSRRHHVGGLQLARRARFGDVHRGKLEDGTVEPKGERPKIYSNVRYTSAVRAAVFCHENSRARARPRWTSASWREGSSDSSSSAATYAPGSRPSTTTSASPPTSLSPPAPEVTTGRPEAYASSTG